MYSLALLFALCLTQAESNQSSTQSITSIVTVLPPDYTEGLPPKKLLQSYRSDRRMLFGPSSSGGRRNGQTAVLLDSDADDQLFRSRNNDDGWNWDTYCQLQPQYGTQCTKPEKRFYYDRQLDSCLPFQYTGCKKNKNNFNSLWECDGYCKGAAYSDIAQKDPDDHIICSLQPNAGRCLAYFQSYYFDINSRTCKSFGYGGCGGNQNNFRTRRACSDFCKRTLRESPEDAADSYELSSDDEPESSEEPYPTPPAVKRAKKKKHAGDERKEKSNKDIIDISKSNEGYMANSKIENRDSEEDVNVKLNKDKVDDQLIQEAEVNPPPKENDGDLMSVNTFSGSRDSVGIETTDKSQSKKVFDKIIKEAETKTTPTPINEGDTISLFAFDDEKNTIGKNNKDEAENAITGSDEAQEIDKTNKESERKGSPKHDDDSVSIMTFSDSDENLSVAPNITISIHPHPAFS